MNQLRTAAKLAAMAAASVLIIAHFATAKDPVDAKTLASDKQVAEKLAAMGAEVTFCESGLVDTVNFAEEDPHSLEPQISTADLKTIRPLLDKLSAVREVSFVMNLGDPTDLRQLYGIKKLGSLNLQSGATLKIEAKHLAGLGDGGSLRHLTILGPNIDDALPAIAEFESLETFTVYTKVDERRLAELAALPNLRSIALTFQPASDATAEALAKIETLESVQLGTCDISDAGMKHIAKLKRLTRINLSNASFTDAGVAELTACAELTHLVIGGGRVTNESLKHIGRLKSLVHLDLTGSAVTDAGLAELESLAELRTRNVAVTQITQRGIDRLRTRLPRLEASSGLPDFIDPPTAWMLWQKKAHVEWKPGTVSVISSQSESVKLTADDLAAIKGGDGLERLGLNDCPIGDKDLDVVTRFKKLRGLGLAGTRITDEGIVRLEALAELKELDLSRTAISDAAVDHLLALERLEKVEIRDTQITIKAAARLRKKMRVETGLE